MDDLDHGEWNMHRGIALAIVHTFGGGPVRIMLAPPRPYAAVCGTPWYGRSMPWYATDVVTWAAKKMTTLGKLVPPASGAMSFAALKRPLLADEQRRLGGEWNSDFDSAQLLRAVAAKFGQRAADELARQLAWSWMLESMNARLLDAETGPAPRFIRRLERSVKQFGQHLN